MWRHKTTYNWVNLDGLPYKTRSNRDLVSCSKKKKEGTIGFFKMISPQRITNKLGVQIIVLKKTGSQVIWCIIEWQ